MFKGIDDSILLDEEQRKAIISDEDYSLIIAGAGSGKTTTMAAKVKYLIEKRNVDPSKIILLAFTNKACEELSNRINNDFRLNVDVLTFHKLGMNFLKKIFSKPPRPIQDGISRKIIIEYITKEIFEDKDKLKDFVNTFDKYIKFDDKCYVYKSFSQYYEHYVDLVYQTNKLKLKEFCDVRIKKRMRKCRAIDGDFYKSIGETDIANYLFKNGIDYEYEKRYPYETTSAYLPDFTINNNGIFTYIEYYGLNKYYENGLYSKDDVNYYNKLIDKKRKLHNNNKTDLIELYSDYDSNTNYIKELIKELEKRNIVGIKKNYVDIFKKLMYTEQTGQYFKLISLFQTFIDRYKEMGNGIKDFEFYINKTNDKKIKKQLSYLKDFYIFYERKIHKNYQVDYADMINYAYRYVDVLKRNNKSLAFDYVIVDEYQDISMQRYNLLKRISELFDSKIVAVGDDWQAIYSFSGSDIELFTNFYQLMGYADILKIENTYRNSQELLDITTDFVSRDTSTFDKNLKSNKHLDKPVEIIYYNREMPISKYNNLTYIIEKIYEENNNGNILLLGRYNDELEDLLATGYFKKKNETALLYSKNPNINIEFLTVHKSKGLGYDNVIILNGINAKKGFPSQIEDEPVIKVLNYDRISNIAYPEERRLFYVALTRTKNKVYVLAPFSPREKRSEFVLELEKNKNVDKNI